MRLESVAWPGPRWPTNSVEVLLPVPQSAEAAAEHRVQIRGPGRRIQRLAKGPQLDECRRVSLATLDHPH